MKAIKTIGRATIALAAAALYFACSNSFMDTIKAVDGEAKARQVAPATPAAPTVTSGIGQIDVSFPPILGVTEFTVYYDTANDPAGATVKKTFVQDPKAPALSIKSLAEGATYYIWVKAANEGGTSGFSPSASATVPGASSPVAAPQFLPAPGTYHANQSIALSCGTTGATIYYTTDGSDPASSSTRAAYGATPIPANGPSATTTIKAIAEKTGIPTSASSVAAYTVTYQYTLTVQLSDALGGSTTPSGSINSIDYGVAQNITATANSNYKFTGWTVVTGSGVAIADASAAGTATTATLSAGDATIKANFVKTTFALIYDANGSDTGVGSVPAIGETYSAGVTVTVKGNSGGLAKLGCDFGGWNNKQDGTGTITCIPPTTQTLTMGSADLTLYAKWNPKYLPVSYSINGGTGTNSLGSTSYYYGSSFYPAAKQVAWSYTGYTLDPAKWNDKADGTGKDYAYAASATMPPNALVLYAKWVPTVCTIIYSKNGGTGTPPVDVGHDYNTSFNLANNTDLTNGSAVFLGWDSQPEGMGTHYAAGALFGPILVSQTLYARWKVPVSGLSLIPAYTATIVGATTQLAPTVTPNNATDQTITWTSSPTGIVSIDSAGLVTALAVGSTTVTATSNDNVSKKATALFDVSRGITTVVGQNTVGSIGDGGPAASALINKPQGVAVDASGNIYFTDTDNHKIRKIDTGGTITTFAGTGAAGFTADGGNRLAAKFDKPIGLAFDSAGNLYIADMNNNRIRKINMTTDLVSTVAGNGSTYFGADGGAATGVNGNIWLPMAVAFDAADNMYIADSANNRIRRVDHSTQLITTVAGDGTAGTAGIGYVEGSAATSVHINNPTGVAVNASGSNVYIVERGNWRVDRVTVADGYIWKVAGNGANSSTGDGSLATSAGLGSYPYGYLGQVALDASENIYIADGTSLRQITKADGKMNTIAGNGSLGLSPPYGDGGPAASGQINALGLFVSSSGSTIYIADTQQNRIRKVQ